MYPGAAVRATVAAHTIPCGSCFDVSGWHSQAKQAAVLFLYLSSGSFLTELPHDRLPRDLGLSIILPGFSRGQYLSLSGRARTSSISMTERAVVYPSLDLYDTSPVALGEIRLGNRLNPARLLLPYSVPSQGPTFVVCEIVLIFTGLLFN